MEFFIAAIDSTNEAHSMLRITTLSYTPYKVCHIRYVPKDL
ncbi:hypothetical protein SAMN05444342_3758 [Haladaptatus paucihalophilus DX253]|uniref:Uncharacterized protein n=1 Tax=Haladaptatus paucihalophilus DX253 TaxID=797209 RepID=A0A1M7A958_HALPU|nr:hypothetical protein SAMN05444342_3758 [Haladaptatus paucihalophilus DX253]